MNKEEELEEFKFLYNRIQSVKDYNKSYNKVNNGKYTRNYIIQSILKQLRKNELIELRNLFKNGPIEYREAISKNDLYQLLILDLAVYCIYKGKDNYVAATDIGGLIYIHNKEYIDNLI